MAKRRVSNIMAKGYSLNEIFIKTEETPDGTGYFRLNTSVVL